MHTRPRSSSSPSSVILRRRRAGFTFIELMFVLVTLAILTGVLLPKFGPSFDRLQTERVAFETAQLLRYAQATAVATRMPVQLVVDAEAHRLWLATERDGRLQPLEDRLVKSRRLPDKVQVSLGRDDQEPLQFLPDGTSRQAVVSVKDAAGNAYRITVDATTGQVAVFSGAAAL